MTERQTFAAWLLEEMDRRNWSRVELAAQSGVSEPKISMVIDEERAPGPEICVGCARAFEESPIKIFQIAGLLPYPENDRAELRELMNLARRLSDDSLRVLLAKARELTEQEETDDEC
jgi:transcriptional regulator with XRE-family HTH domain